MKKFMRSGMTVRIRGEERTEGPVLWVLLAESEEEKTAGQYRKDCVLITVTGFEWNRDLSPWPARKIFPQGEDFGGRAGQFLRFLEEDLVPETEKYLRFAVEERGILGYSMAGLFAVSAMYQTSLFTGVASVSGSLWFDGWKEYAMSHPMKRHPCIYLSLGRKERCTRNPRMALVEEHTDALARYWGKSCSLVYEKNAGGHFTEYEKRMSRGMEELIRLMKKNEKTVALNL